MIVFTATFPTTKPRTRSFENPRQFVDALRRSLGLPAGAYDDALVTAALQSAAFLRIPLPEDPIKDAAHARAPVTQDVATAIARLFFASREEQPTSVSVTGWQDFAYDEQPPGRAAIDDAAKVTYEGVRVLPETRVTTEAGVSSATTQQAAPATVPAPMTTLEKGVWVLMGASIAWWLARR